MGKIQNEHDPSKVNLHTGPGQCAATTSRAGTLPRMIPYNSNPADSYFFFDDRSFHASRDDRGRLQQGPA